MESVKPWVLTSWCVYLSTHLNIPIRRRSYNILVSIKCPIVQHAGAPITRGNPHSLTYLTYSTDAREHLFWEEPVQIFVGLPEHKVLGISYCDGYLAVVRCLSCVVCQTFRFNISETAHASCSNGSDWLNK